MWRIVSLTFEYFIVNEQKNAQPSLGEIDFYFPFDFCLFRAVLIDRRLFVSVFIIF